MGVSQGELERAREFYPSLRSIREWEGDGQVNAVVAAIEGRRGGQRGWWLWGPHARQTYEVVLDVSNLRAAIPGAWILSPADPEIRHLNIFHGGMCPVFGRKLPQVCWGTFVQTWSEAPHRQRTLGAVLELVKQLLNQQNPRSPAR